MTDGSTELTPSWRVRINMVVGRILFGALYRVDVVGRRRVPRTGPVVFVANHVGFLDGPLLPALAPRPTSVLVKREMFKGLLGWFLTWIGHIPVTRSRMVVEFGEPMDLAPDAALTGRQRLAAATDTVRETLATHVRESQERHRVFLPED